MKPKLLYDVIRQASPRKFVPNQNRYNLLRDASPADSVRSDQSFRSRSQSIKRKSPEDSAPEVMTYAAVTSPDIQVQPPDCDSKVEEVTENIVKVKSICEKVSAEVSNANVDPALISIFGLLNEAILGICDNQQQIVSMKQGKTYSQPPPSQSDSSSGSQKRAKQDRYESNFVDLRNLSQRPPAPERRQTNPDPDPKVKAFKEAVKEAEKSTLIFNLNLGTVPIINKDTMSTKVTKALQEKAAKKEGKNSSIPSNETILAIDDVLSVVKGMNFYGKTTKSYNNPRDINSGAYCTIPVRYDFADKDSRFYAETVLRDKCKVSCSTPYPLMLRETIKQIVEQTKQVNPNHFVKVNVDTNSMSLKISKRPMLAEGDKSKKVWSNVGDPVPIPPECLDLSIRTVPKDYKVKMVEYMDSSDASGSASNGSANNIGNAAGSGSGSKPPPTTGTKSPQRRGSSKSQKE
jgi:hypothetical protein